MADDKHSSLSSQVIAGLIVAAVLGAISFVPGAFKWVSEVATNFWSHLRGTSEFPNWSLYLLALMSIHTLVYLAARVIKPKGPNVATYNHDTFLDLKWRWSYISGLPANAWAFCPHCDTMLVYSEVGSRFDPDRKTVLTCETCNRDLLHHEGGKDYLVQKIHRQIDRKIRTGEWQSAVECNP
ncbi:hypothetical protein [Thiobacillus sp.]|uniref:hypothetical protein n=1 Tax=Thiobacillus sp. TaxID=924 RepID=UPI00286D93A2|nr:hypothetical protein [Thiobacillus sp.]